MRSTARPGFSLLEVLVALVLVTVGLFPVLALDGVTYRQRRVTSLHMEAGVRARAAAVQAASMEYETLVAAASRDWTLPCSGAPADFPGQIQTTIQSADHDAGERRPGLLLLTVTVRWGPYGRMHEPERGTLVVHRLVADPVRSITSDHGLRE